ncbi:PHP domain-containing protein [Cellulomonas sp. zg-ZUI222]|uniref:PHP domain-containing protein n=1 Tax=Cellulomonas TaxID=1707 RepID=UPI001A94B1D3|nr:MULTISPECIES: PHP domain-containing protein [Cellulomonas]MBO0900301.1 PHP domain-containing protein [Cellulomonas sp. zg-ZUI22]MBO0920785.1 PHP domain-containing protein [Cellulomonas wangleii]
MSAQDDQDRAVAALRRIAFLLERGQAGRYRSEAYRAAARTVERQDPARLAALAAAGSLTDLPAVGSSTAGVVSRAMAGRAVPALDELEARAAEQDAGLSPEGAALHAALRGDLHTHTDASDGSAPLQEMVLAAVGLGRDYLAVTDHSPRLTVAHGLSAARLRAQLDQIAALRPAVAPFEVLSGIEVDVLEDGTLDQDPDLLDELDVVVASVHSKLRMDRAAMTRRMITAVRDPRTDVLGHCTGRQVGAKHRPPSEFDARAVFDACAEHGVAVEINCRPDRLDPPHELLQVAVDAGCDVTIDSDAHAPGQLDWLRVGCERAVAHGIGPERVVTTRPAHEVRQRARR